MDIDRRLWVKDLTESSEGYRALLASAFAFSLMTVCVKHLNERIPVAEIVFTRSVISLIITNLLIKKAGISPWGNRKVLLFIRGVLGTAALFCVFKAIKLLPLASATIIQYSYPTFTALAAWIILGETSNKRIGLAIIIGWLGITITAQPYEAQANFLSISFIPIIIALAGAILTALAYVCVRKLSESEHPLVIVNYFPMVSIPITFPFVLSQGILPSGIDWIWLLGVGVLTQLGQVWITTGLSLIPVARASSFNYVQVIFAALWGVLFFSEGISAGMLLGAIFILLSTLISVDSSAK